MNEHKGESVGLVSKEGKAGMSVEWANILQ